eukprot:CAMPEP_0194194310 /NCGR_PEP_ID=MMETSP0154-20130528/75514_1 /TAXON_ID=1049557 /ORGANISM="Thalassiothrix antarctica, Strain L6-D1" /LENGTH=266 /DNA_ID=CAMNT_0038918731 /DNA_START=96 /DNA_END=896 /DNA_ORIENTATION=-
MKFSLIATLTLIGSCSAFTSLSSTSNNVVKSSIFRNYMSEEKTNSPLFFADEVPSTPPPPSSPPPSSETIAAITTTTEELPEKRVGPMATTAASASASASVVSLPEMSRSMPFMKRPAILDGSIAGDVGFDPLGFANTKENLVNYREAEIKHARLAMLAAAGWPLSELWDWKIAVLFGMPALVDNADRAPSILNGGLDKVSPFYWIGCLIFAGAVDFYGSIVVKKNNPDYFPGNLGFDPLGLYPKDAEGQKQMQLKEIKNGLDLIH